MSDSSRDKEGGSETFSLTDLARKVVSAGIGSAAIARDVVTDPKLRKEVLGSILSKAEKHKEDLMGILAREVSKFLGKLDVSDEIRKALSGLIINLSASVDFQEKKKGGKPVTKVHSANVRKTTGQKSKV